MITKMVTSNIDYENKRNYNHNLKKSEGKFQLYLNSISKSSLFVIFLLTLISSTLCTKMKNSISNLNNDSTPLTVHVVPHTHDDAGWNWTFEEYYLGTGGSKASVKKILDNFVDSLYDRKDRTFIYVEMAFFSKWYREQSEIKKTQVKNLLKEGRFEFINGGYVMHDEAASYYQHSIDQMRLGLMFLKEEFNYVPEIAWFIDPFGHSASNAFILSKMGFKKIALVRIDYREKNYRKIKKSLEFFYIPFGQIDESVKIFTHVTFDHYCTPPPLDPFILDQKLELGVDEIKTKAEDLASIFKGYTDRLRHKNSLLMYGCDFTHNERSNNWQNLESVMDYVNDEKNNNLGIKMVYSTPSKYFDVIFSQVDEWPIYRDYDFFPYADSEFSTWTGYFTSRPYLKGMVREAGNYLSAISQSLLKIIFKFNYDKNCSQNIDPKYKERLLSNIILNDNKQIEFNLEKNFLKIDVKEINKDRNLTSSRPSNSYYNNNMDSQKCPIENLIEEAIDKLFFLREIHAITQHHDAVAGTAKERVSQDYIKMLDVAIRQSKESIIKLLKNFRKDKNSDFKICMDPTVDFKCLEDMFNFDENNKLYVKVKNYQSLDNEANTENFLKDKDYDNRDKVIIKGFEIGSGYHLEKKKIKDIFNPPEKTEMFCIDELKDKTLNCKVYFKSQNHFLFTSEKNSSLIHDEINQNEFLNKVSGKKHILNGNSSLNNNIQRENFFGDQNKNNDRIDNNLHEKNRNIKRVYFKDLNDTSSKKEFVISDNLKVYYEESKNQLTFNLNLNITNNDSNSNNNKINQNYIFQISHAYYISYNGSNSNLRPDGSCPSGAYILSTTEIEPKKFDFIPEKSYIESGKFYKRIVMRFSNSYIIIILENKNNKTMNITKNGIKENKNSNQKLFGIYEFSRTSDENVDLNNYFQIESIWDPIADDAIPKEYLLLISSNLDNSVNLPNGKSEPEFWTDSNGIKMMRRFKDYREGYDYFVTDPVAGNFYPVNSMISFRDRNNYKYTEDHKKNDYLDINYNDRMITYLNDRSQSIGVMKKGEIIIIQNRHSYRDDWKGLEEIMKENHSFKTYFKLKSFLVFGGDERTIRKLERSIQDRFYLIASSISYAEQKGNQNQMIKS